jgi:hypothetical protein
VGPTAVRCDEGQARAGALRNAANEAEDGEFGPERRGHELPGWVKDKSKGLEVIEAEDSGRLERRRWSSGGGRWRGR